MIAVGATPIYAEAYRISRAVHGDTYRTLTAMNNWGDTLLMTGQLDAAVRALDSLVARARRALGPGHPALALALMNASIARLERGRPGDVEQALAWTADAARSHGEDHPWATEAALTRLSALRAAGEWIALADHAQRTVNQSLSRGDSGAVARAQAELAFAHLALGRTTRADASATAAIREADDEGAALAHLALVL